MTKKGNDNQFSNVFIIPHYSNEREEPNGKMFIADTLEGLFSQTDDDWSAIIVVNSRKVAIQQMHRTRHPSIRMDFRQTEQPKPRQQIKPIKHKNKKYPQ